MPLALTSTLGTGYSTTATSELFYAVGSTRAWAGKKRPLIYCHPASGSTLASINSWGQSLLIHALAQDHLVIVADLGGDPFGNATHLSRIADAIAYAAARGATGKPVLVGVSMGALGALGYARANPGTVAAVAGIIPALDLADLRTRPGGLGAMIDAAYPPSGYNDTTHGPTRSPVRYAATLPTSLPIRLWTASDDIYAVPSTADAFVNARPTTIRTNVGAVGHTETAIATAVATLPGWLASVI